MALLKATILFSLLGNIFSLLLPDSDGRAVEIKGDDIVRGVSLNSPITFAGEDDIKKSIQTLYVRKFVYITLKMLKSFCYDA